MPTLLDWKRTRFEIYRWIGEAWDKQSEYSFRHTFGPRTVDKYYRMMIDNSIHEMVVDVKINGRKDGDVYKVKFVRIVKPLQLEIT